VNFTSSITLMFKDAFSSGFTQAKNSFAGMKDALGEINQNQEMNRMAADLSMMTSMTEPMRQALSGALDEPSRIAATLDSSLKNIQAVTGNTAQEMAGLRQELLAVGGKAIAGPEAVTAAYYDVAGGVADVSARMATLKASVALAEAGQADLGSATNGLIKVMNAYGFSADQADFAADVFTQTVGKGVGSMDEFVAAMSPIAGLTASVGVGFDEVGSAMAFMTSKGQTAGVAGNQLKAAITSLLNPNETLNKLLQSMGIASGSAMLKQYGLAESLNMIQSAAGGSQDAMAKALGSTEALQGAIALTQDSFNSFATDFGDGVDGITAKARAVQLESIEAKMKRLEAASSSLQAQIGGDVNEIKGFFMDVKIGFLENFAAPLMNSPVGPAMSKITAYVGMGAKAVLDMGSGALNTAAQLSVLTANIQNAGGIAKLLKGTLGLLGAPFKSVISLAGGFVTKLFGIGASSATAAGGTGAFGAASAGASGGIGVATGATTAFGASMWAAVLPVLAVVAAIALVAGGVYLLVKNWDAVSGFFVGLWEGVKGIFSAAWDWLVNLFRSGVEWIKGVIFGASDWILAAVALFLPFIGIPALVIKHWDGIKTFFVELWGNVKTSFTNFLSWIGGAVEAFIAPFKKIAGGISDFFGKLFGEAKDSGAKLTDTFAQGIQGNAGAPSAAFGSSLQGIGSQMPHSDADEGPLSRLSESGRALTDTFAAGMDPATLEQRATLAFQAAAPGGEISLGAANAESAGAAAGPQTFHIENLYLQADDCRTLLDFLRQIQHAVYRPEEVPV
jgi:TP901 family phage tail tape measure protein